MSGRDPDILRTASTSAASRTFKSLKAHRNYRLFFAGQITSVCGTWMQNVALYWLVLSLTHSAVAVGLLSLARFGPFTLFGLFGGVIADRFDNRKTVIATQSVQMTLSGVLAAVTLAGAVRPWEIYLLAAGMGLAFVPEVPARQSLTFQMVGRAELANAVALNSSLFNAARIVGPALAGVVIAGVGAGWCFAINAASFVAVLAGLLAMRPAELFPLERRGKPTIWGGTREALAYVRSSRTAKVLIGMASVLVAISFNMNVLLPVLTQQTLAAGPRTFGALSACFGGGALVGALVSAARADTRWRALLAGAGVLGLAELAIAPLRSVFLIGALLFLCGACWTTYAANANAALQLDTPDYLRGRVLGFYYYAWNGPAPLAGPLMGWLCAVGGTTLAFGIAGACAICAATVGALVIGRGYRGRETTIFEPGLPEDWRSQASAIRSSS